MSELTSFTTLLTKIIREHARILESIERGKGGRADLCRVAKEHFEKKLTFRAAPTRDLDRQLPSITKPRVDLIEQRSVFLLHPPSKGDAVLPVITLRCDFARQPILCRIYTALYYLHASENGDSRLNIMGFRCEAPEGLGSGRHDMHHLQFINGFKKDVPFQGTEIKTLWLPARQPAVPIDASCAVTLLIALLVSIYGLGYLEDIVKIDPAAKTYIQKMTCWQVKESLLNEMKARRAP